METKLQKALVGAKGITYLMYVGREVNTAYVAKILHQNKLIKNKNVAYSYSNNLEGMGLIKTVRVKVAPGPPKIRTANLELIFDMVSFYRVWKMLYENHRKLTDQEKLKLTSLFKGIVPLLDYFLQYLSLWLKFHKAKVRRLHLNETLSVFFEFSRSLVEACWQICEHNMDLEKLEIKHVAKEGVWDLFDASFQYIGEAYKKGKVNVETISTLARFSVNGSKDVYRDTFLRELYLTSISLRNPLTAFEHFIHTEDIEEAMLEHKLERINVLPLFRAVINKACSETRRIRRELEKIADHKVRDEMRKKFYKYDEKAVDKALEDIIEKLSLAMSKEDLMTALVNMELCRLLRSKIEHLNPPFMLERKRK